MSNDPEEKDSSSKTTINYQIQFSLDQFGFLRRECTECGRHFKVKVDASELSTLLVPAFQHVEREFGIPLPLVDQPSEAFKAQLTCPYCGHTDDAPNMMTDELFAYVRRWATREIIHPLINKQLKDFSNSFSNNRGHHNSGFFSIDISFTHHPSPLPIRPISGPELPDMKPIYLLCCHKEIKVNSNWFDTIHCPYCSQILVLH